jgi:DHA2 family multidrug resistance protein
MILYVLVFSLLAVVLNLTLPLIGSIYILEDLGGDTFTSSYAISFFCIGNMLTVPLGKPGSTQINPIHLYLICFLSMIFFSLLCSLATNYFCFNLFRFLEGVSSGPLYLLITYKLVPDLVPEKDRPYATYMLTLCFALGPVLGASWGGWIAFYHNWRFLFVSHIIYCLFLISYMYSNYRTYYEHAESPPITLDKLAYFLYIISLIFIGTGLTTGQELDWFRSNLIAFFLITGSVCLLFLIIRCLTSEHPLIDLKLLKKFYFSLAIIYVGLLFAIYFGMILLLSLWLKLYINYSPLWIILSIAVTVLGAWIPIVIQYEGYDPRIPLGIALIFLLISSYYTTTFNVEINFERIVSSRIFTGIGLTLFLAPLFRLSMHSFSGKRFAECLNFFHIARLFGTGIGMSLFVTLWHRRQVFYYERLGSRLTEFSPSTHQFLKNAHQFHIEGKHAFAKLSDYLQRQATALALEDCFYLMSWMLVLLLLTLLTTFFFGEPSFDDKKVPGNP